MIVDPKADALPDRKECEVLQYELILSPFPQMGGATTTEAGPFFTREEAERALTAALSSGKFMGGKIVTK